MVEKKKKIQWDESISVNNKKMDEQHKHLFDIFNNLLDQENSEHSTYIPKLISELDEYMENHLNEEEILMQSIGYPDYENHCELHKSFKRALERLKFQVKNGELSQVGISSVALLENWLLNHIKTDDQDYGRYILNLAKKNR